MHMLTRYILISETYWLIFLNTFYVWSKSVSDSADHNFNWSKLLTPLFLMKLNNRPTSKVHHKCTHTTQRPRRQYNHVSHYMSNKISPESKSFAYFLCTKVTSLNSFISWIIKFLDVTKVDVLVQSKLHYNEMYL